MKQTRFFLLFLCLFGIFGCTAEPPHPKPAASKLHTDCQIAPLPQPGPNASPLTLGREVTGGIFTASTVILPQQVKIKLRKDLVIVAEKDMTMEGMIQGPSQLIAGEPSVNITLVSLKGKIKISDTALIGQGFAASGKDSTHLSRPAKAVSEPGSNGGYLKIVAREIEIAGRIYGNIGGSGGTARANTAQAPGFFNESLRRLSLGGQATAVGAQGGFGGDVLLCGSESLRVGSTLSNHTAEVVGGDGGLAGSAEAIADQGSNAYVESGSGNQGGDVIIQGIASTPLQVFIDDVARGGSGGWGVKVAAKGGRGSFGKGGFARAVSGSGAKGGTVKFANALVMNVGIVRSGWGGRGGSAEALSGRGGHFWFYHSKGGNVSAKEGKGGLPGEIPQIPVLPAGQMKQGSAGKPGLDGDADALPGDGGKK